MVATHQETHQESEAPIVSLAGVSFTYDTGLLAVSGLDLEIRAREILAIIGPSGCGKSTILSLLAGLQAPVGTMQWNDEMLAEAGPARRRLTMMFQKDTVLPWLTVERNVAFGLRFLKMSTEEKRRRVDWLLSMVGLEEFRHAHPRQLSGGMRRRVALLTSLAPLPSVLLLDEPFAALDEPTRVGVHRDLLRIVHEMETTVVMVTHDVSEAVSVADRVCVSTIRPARVAAMVEVGPTQGRDPGAFRETAVYQDRYQRAWTELWSQMGRIRPAGQPDHQPPDGAPT